MNWNINRSRDIPLYTQLMNAVLYAVCRGDFKPGDTIPSIRECEHETKVNINTVSKAYKGLGTMGIIDSRRGALSTITAKGVQLARDTTKKELETRSELLMADGVESGFSIQMTVEPCLFD